MKLRLKTSQNFFFIFFLLFGCKGDNNSGGGISPDGSIPTELTAVAITPTEIHLSWKANSADTTIFEIQRKDPGAKDFVPKGHVTKKTTYEDSNVLPDLEYQYRIRGFGRLGSSPFSTTISAKPLPPPPGSPNAPSNINALVNNTGSLFISLSWTDESLNETVFRIERKEGEGYYFLAEVGANITSYVDTNNINPGIQYTYRVMAKNDTGQSLPTEGTPVTVTALAGAPSAPSNLMAVAFDSSSSSIPIALVGPSWSVTLSWSYNLFETNQFVIERNIGTGSFEAISTITLSSTQYTDTSVSTGLTYSYQVRAKNSVGLSLPSNVATVYVGTIFPDY